MDATLGLDATPRATLDRSPRSEGHRAPTQATVIRLARGGVVGLTVFSLLLITVGRAQAHGGALQVAGGRAGPYVVSVWTQPDPPRVGRLDVSVAVMEPGTRKPVLDAETRVVGKQLGTSGSTSARAVLDVGWLYSMYYANLELPTAGRWRIAVSVAAPDGNGSTAFDLDVRPPSPIPWRLIWTVVTLLLFTLIAWPWLHPSTHRQSG